MNPKSKKITRIILQITLIVVIFAALLWYIGIEDILTTFANIQIEYLILALLASFCINLLYAFRLHRLLNKEGIKSSYIKTLMAHYAGVLTSDVTPGRSGYLITPLYLKNQNIPSSVSLPAILGIQSIEFIAKVIGGVIALFFLLTYAIHPIDTSLFIIITLGITLMLTGALLLAAMSCSKRAINIVKCIASNRLLKRFTKSIVTKLEEYAVSAQRIKKSLPELTIITIICWLFKATNWLFIATAIGITQLAGYSSLTFLWIAFFLLHPLITAFGFVPITPSGAIFQDGAIVGVFYLLGIEPHIGIAFALVSRILQVVEDMIGIPQIAKSTTGLLSKKLETPNHQQPTNPNQTQ